MSDIGHNIKMLREANKMSQSELASKIGRTRAAISQFENGANNPSTRTIEAIANVLNVNVSDISDGRIEYASVNYVSNRNAEIRKLFHMLDSENKDVLIATAKALIKAQNLRIANEKDA